MVAKVDKIEKRKENGKLKATKSKKLGVVKCRITNNKTLFTSHKKTSKKWIVVDATNVVCGRLGAYIVNHLKGKHLASYTPNTDDGDKIVVVNCDKIKFTGNKEEQKLYRDHSDYVGNVRTRTAKEVREGKRPTDLLRTTVKRMLGRCRLNYKLLSKNLYLYAGEVHKQEQQKPVLVNFAGLNCKNVVK